MIIFICIVQHFIFGSTNVNIILACGLGFVRYLVQNNIGVCFSYLINLTLLTQKNVLSHNAFFIAMSRILESYIQYIKELLIKCLKMRLAKTDEDEAHLLFLDKLLPLGHSQIS